MVLPHRDAQGTTWSLAFDSEETKVLVLGPGIFQCEQFQDGFTQESLLCRGVAEQGALAFTLARGEGPGLERGDQVEIRFILLGMKCAKN